MYLGLISRNFSKQNLFAFQDFSLHGCFVFFGRFGKTFVLHSVNSDLLGRLLCIFPPQTDTFGTVA